jgi:hypothetical protein
MLKRKPTTQSKDDSTSDSKRKTPSYQGEHDRRPTTAETVQPVPSARGTRQRQRYIGRARRAGSRRGGGRDVCCWQQNPEHRAQHFAAYKTHPTLLRPTCSRGLTRGAERCSQRSDRQWSSVKLRCCIACLSS